MSAPATIKTMPQATRRSTFSPNANHANSAVNTPSAFSSEAPDAGMRVNPSISRTGAATPPHPIAAASQGISARVGCTLGAPVSRRYSHSPRPEPR